MSLAPLPDHRYVNAPSWQADFARFEHLITPLRERGLVCDVDFGITWLVHAHLHGEEYLTISGNEDCADDAHPDGWLITRGNPEEGSVEEVVYDSQPTGPQHPNGAALKPLLAAVESHCTRLGIPLQDPATAQEHFPESASKTVRLTWLRDGTTEAVTSHEGAQQVLRQHYFQDTGCPGVLHQPAEAPGTALHTHQAALTLGAMGLDISVRTAPATTTPPPPQPPPGPTVRRSR